MDRRNFLGVLGGAIAAVAGWLGLGRVAKVKPLSFRGVPLQFGPGYTAQFPSRDKAELLPKMRTAMAKIEFNPPIAVGWPQEYSLAVKLPQPKNRPLQVMAGLSYWIDRPTEIVRCTHLGLGFYAGEHRGMRLRAIAERLDGKLICKYTAWDGEWNA